MYVVCWSLGVFHLSLSPCSLVGLPSERRSSLAVRSTRLCRRTWKRLRLSRRAGLPFPEATVIGGVVKSVQAKEPLIRGQIADQVRLPPRLPGTTRNEREKEGCGVHTGGPLQDPLFFIHSRAGPFMALNALPSAFEPRAWGRRRNRIISGHIPRRARSLLVAFSSRLFRPAHWLVVVPLRMHPSQPPRGYKCPILLVYFNCVELDSLPCSGKARVRCLLGEHRSVGQEQECQDAYLS